MFSHNATFRGAFFALGFLGSLLVGCAAPRQPGLARGAVVVTAESHGPGSVHTRIAPLTIDDTVIFVDGAGGGGMFMDWSREVQRGLREAGYRGHFQAFAWQTGLGPVSDQCASVQYKRERARGLADDVRRVRATRPNGRIHLIASSAGTAVGVFALEAMGESEYADTVVLLSSALSSAYDLTLALRHVRDQVLVFTSPHDALLKTVMPLLGTSDRAYVARHVAGLEGFVCPASPEAASEYSKVCEVPWRAEWTALGNTGGHTDSKRSVFVRAVVAPLLLTAPAVTRDPIRSDVGVTVWVSR